MDDTETYSNEKIEDQDRLLFVLFLFGSLSISLHFYFWIENTLSSTILANASFILLFISLPFILLLSYYILKLISSYFRRHTYHLFTVNAILVPQKYERNAFLYHCVKTWMNQGITFFFSESAFFFGFMESEEQSVRNVLFGHDFYHTVNSKKKGKTAVSLHSIFDSSLGNNEYILCKKNEISATVTEVTANLLVNGHILQHFSFPIESYKSISFSLLSHIILQRTSLISADLHFPGSHFNYSDSIYTVEIGNYPHNSLPVLIPDHHLLYHTGIFGLTGTGKTTLSIFLLLQLDKERWKITIFDIKGEYMQFFPPEFVRRVSFDGKSPIPLYVGENRHNLHNILFETINSFEAHELSPGMSSLLYEILDKAVHDPAPLTSLISYLTSIANRNNPQSLSAQALLNRIKSRLPKDIRNNLQITTQSQTNTPFIEIIDFSTLPPGTTSLELIQLFWSLYLSSKLELAQSENAVKQLVVMEEATISLIKRSSSSLSIFRTILMGRSFNIGVWMIGQDASTLPLTLASNLSNLILLKSRSTISLQSLGISSTLSQLLSLLGDKRGVLITKDEGRPSLFQMPGINLEVFSHLENLEPHDITSMNNLDFVLPSSLSPDSNILTNEIIDDILESVDAKQNLKFK